MSLEECMSIHTHRQYRTWMVWLENEWNNPSRNDHYLMQIIVEIRRIFAKNPASVTMPQAKLKFINKDDEKPEPTEAEIAYATMQAKSRWGMLAGLFKSKPASETKVPK
jgi:hypothetical protein